MAVKGARTLRVHRSEAQTLDGHRSEGYARQRAGTPVSASILCLQHVNAAATQGYRAVTANRTIFPLAACFQHVYRRKHVNALFFALAGRSPLIPLTFPHGYRAVSPQQPAGDDMSQRTADAVGSAVLHDAD
jgi:hypothetical protein